MCGIAGFISANAGSEDAIRSVVESMTKCLTHRGPDDEGYFIHEGVALGQRRLSILDLSPAGHQPMSSRSGRFTAILNGEIYNYLEIKRELSITTKGNSDTEVLLAAIEAWGVERTLKQLTGMFAFAIFDRNENTLTIARDRIGEKPLYYGLVGRSFVFASELKSFKKFPNWTGVVRRQSVAAFLRFSYVPGPDSIYESVWKLSPGSYLTIAVDAPSEVPSAKFYWSPADFVTQSKIHLPHEEKISELDRLLSESVRGQMISDVPLGAFLSGGIDSSLVVALMQKNSSSAVKTFSIGFSEDGFNEAHHAKQIANHLKTDHHELYVTSKEAQDLIPELPTIYDEPFADSSQIPTTLLARLTRKHVTVSLSGDGGDELFGGYPHYQTVMRMWEIVGWLPQHLRTSLGVGAGHLPKAFWDLISPLLLLIVGKENIRAKISDRIPQIAELLQSKTFYDFYYRLLYQMNFPGDFVIGSKFPTLESTHVTAHKQDLMMFEDLVHYLPDDILTKVDRATMSASLESRAPFLDHRVVEFAMRLPLGDKIANSSGKVILKQLLEKYVPRKLFDRPKMGFRIPLREWLMGPLREWAEEKLASSKISSQGFLNAIHVENIWRQFKSGEVDSSQQLWNILMFQAWLERETR